MPPKRSNKTARVLNLITKPDEHDISENISETSQSMEENVSNSLNLSESAVTPAAPDDTKKAEIDNQAVNQEPKTQLDETVRSVQPQQTDVTQQISEEQVQNVQTPLPPAPQPVVPILQNVREKEHQLEEQILSGLLDTLEAEAEPEPIIEPASELPVSEAESVSEPIAEPPVAEPQSVNEPIPEPPVAEPQSVNEPIPEPLVSEPQSLGEQAAELPVSELLPEIEPIPELENLGTSENPSDIEPLPEPAPEPLDTPDGEQSIICLNVLQELVEIESNNSQNMLRCTCPRCVMDMKAIALSNLPSKYVVIDKDQKNGFISIYNSRYSRQISVQMMRACVIVNEHPHH